ncbi:protein-glutamate O-methyltransferase CheR [Paraglaciecola sp. L1A13]|uniref:CheR family methyltransferase n=1 Tax=Paraglaciecola sp. L1A13 TaxID=2686359 RepID=UPI00131BA997|nr:protein-glutamate O-methyltransferase CheR [Paraglaciecola sp. L1A13]
MSSNTLDDHEYALFCRFLEHRCGIVLGENKQYLVRSRLSPLLGKFNQKSLSDLIKRTLANHDVTLINAVVNAMTTNETLWFRDSYPFDILQQTLLPQLAKSGKKIRIWSAACSSGQEAYSIAMSVFEYQTRNPGALAGGVEIIATDISSEMLSLAEAGQYDNLSLSRGLSSERKARFFDTSSEGNCSVIKQNIRNMVSFKPINLLMPYTNPTRYDVVFCRNVLIYFSATSKVSILQKLAACLQPQGALFVGASESLTGITTEFTMNRSGSGLFYSKKI